MYTRVVLIVGLVSLFLMGCGGDKRKQADIDADINHSIINFNASSGVQCILFASGTMGGVSCNWDKHNELIGKCEAMHNEKYPNFPDVKGRCLEVIKAND
jgi:hypothetical protein